MAKDCKGCIHYRSLNEASGKKVCHYCYDTGEPRGCSSESCDKKKKASPSELKKLKQRNKEIYFNPILPYNCGDVKYDLYL